jgi:hypothetical protein
LVGLEDFDAWLRLAQTGFRFNFVKAFLGDYRVHSRNYTLRDKILIPYAVLGRIQDSLSNYQISRFETNYTYQQLRYDFKNQRDLIAAKDVLLLLRYSKLEFKIKSLYMGLAIFLEKGFNYFRK